MSSCPITLVDNHIIIELDGKNILIDTGAPHSFGETSEIKILGKIYNLADNYLGLTTNELGEYIGADIDIVLGGDVLSKIYFLVDFQANMLYMDRFPVTLDGRAITVSMFMNIPIIQFEINGQQIRAFLDTGAKISYLDPQITANYPSTGTETDFYPGVGQFSTATYEIPVTLNNCECSLVFGNLPELLQMSLMMANTRAILGNDLFKFFKISFALPDTKIVLEKVV